LANDKFIYKANLLKHLILNGCAFQLLNLSKKTYFCTSTHKRL